MHRTPVVAGTHFQFVDFVRRGGLNRELFTYVAGPEQLCGLDRGTLILAAGTWYSRDDMVVAIAEARNLGCQIVEVKG